MLSAMVSNMLAQAWRLPSPFGRDEPGGIQGVNLGAEEVIGDTRS